MNDNLGNSACFSQHCSVYAVFEMRSNAKGVLWSGDVVDFEMETNAHCLNAQESDFKGLTLVSGFCKARPQVSLCMSDWILCDL